MMPVNMRAYVCVCVCVCVLTADCSTELLNYLTVLSVQSEAKLNVSYYFSFTAVQTTRILVYSSLFCVTEINALQISLKI